MDCRLVCKAPHLHPSARQMLTRKKISQQSNAFKLPYSLSYSIKMMHKCPDKAIREKQQRKITTFDYYRHNSTCQHDKITRVALKFETAPNLNI